MLFVCVGSSWIFGKPYESDEHLGAYGWMCCRVEYVWKEICDFKSYRSKLTIFAQRWCLHNFLILLVSTTHAT
jgi:hypothetical protein